MNAPTLNLTSAPLLTQEDLGTLLRVKDLARRAIYHGWIKPCARSAEGGSAKPLFARADVDSLIARVSTGEVPPQLPRKGKEAA
jgi:hypothetical protein